MSTPHTRLLNPGRLGLIAPVAALHFVLGAVSPTLAQSNTALQFDGVNDYVAINRPIQDDFTIEFWMKKTTPEAWASSSIQWWNGRGLVDAEMASVTNDFGIAYVSGSILFGTGNPDRTLQSGQAFVVADGAWRHVACTRQKSTGEKKLYIDGQLAATGTGGVQSLNIPVTIKFGAIQVLTSSHFFAGTLDEIRLWNVVRTQAEIQAGIASCAIAPSTSGLVGYYRLNEGSGLSALDLSPQQNHGTLINGPVWVTGAGPGGGIAFTSQPASTTGCVSGVASFSVAASGSGDLTYRWRKGGVPIDIGIEGNPSAATPTLVLSNLRPTDAGSYDCLVTDGCGSAPSNPATLRICATDFNCDGDLNADDLGDFITCYFSSPPCAQTEFNGDGDLNADDLGDFITAYFAGCG